MNDSKYLTQDQITTRLMGKVVKFLSPEEYNHEYEIDFDKDQKAKIVDINFSHWDEDDLRNAVVELILDFSDYEEENKEFAVPTYYNDRGVACLKWHESKFYPKNNVTRVYLSPESATWPFVLDEEPSNPADRYDYWVKQREIVAQKIKEIDLNIKLAYDEKMST